MGLRQQGGAWENGQQMKEAAFPRRKETKQRMHSALRQPLAPCPLPLAPCPTPPPEANHSKVDLNKMMPLPIRERGKGEGCCGVGSARQKGLGTQKNDKKKALPLPLGLAPHLPQKLPTTQLPLKD